MDYSLDSPLISPTKARQAAIQAKDWAYVNAWLSRKFSPNEVPPFERNEDTLKALLAIAAANETADEEAALLHRAREEIVRAYKRREEEEDPRKKALLEDLEAHLDEKGEESLNDLAETTVSLGSLSTSTAALGNGIMELTRDEFDVADQMREIEALQVYLDKELKGLRKQLDDLKSNPVYEIDPNLTEQTAEWNRSTKLLMAKVQEYHERITTLTRTVTKNAPTIEDIVAEEKSTLELQDNVKRLEARIKAFHDIPPQLDEARAEYKRLERDVQQLRQRRDRMFESAALK
ncbi:hypothetical protein VTN49DRAFT_7078 [Thermomyces lanuginosus]|uniref:uncharacterized protein n=1 Tax=Thermomyces lanuginosus TaxID=5541 RepID=UPI0037424DC6